MYQCARYLKEGRYGAMRNPEMANEPKYNMHVVEQGLGDYQR